MTIGIDELIMSIEAERDLKIRERVRANETVKTILAQARNEGRPDLSDVEASEVKSCFAKRDAANKALTGIELKLLNAHNVKAGEEALTEQQALRTGDPATQRGALPAYDNVARVTSEERTYNRGQEGGQGGFFLRDVSKAFLHRDPQAEQRLFRHMQEERVERGRYIERAAGDAGTGAFAGLTVPQYLTELYAPKARARQPFADACNKHDLPTQGMTVNISQITTGSSTALQAAEFDAASATSMDDTLLTENVQTAAGQQSLSRQAIDRGTGIEDVTMDDLQRSLSTTFDNTLINQATTGLAALGVANAYVDASPTGPELYPKILGAAAGGEAVFLGYAQPDVAVMHSRRWYWMQAQLTSTWPMFGQPGIPAQLAGVNLAERYGAGVRGFLPNGMAVIVDNNIGTTLGAGTEDEIYVAATDECHLWIDPNAPQFIRAEQPKAANLAVVLVLYMYFAYSFRRFGTGSVQKISGTGLIAPVF